MEAIYTTKKWRWPQKWRQPQTILLTRFWPNFWDPIFCSNISAVTDTLLTKLFGPIFWGTFIFVDHLFFDKTSFYPNIFLFTFWTQNLCTKVFDQNVFNVNFFWPHFVDPTFFGQNFFFDKKKIWVKKFVWTLIFFYHTFFWPNLFLPPDPPDPKSDGKLKFKGLRP